MHTEKRDSQTMAVPPRPAVSPVPVPHPAVVGPPSAVGSSARAVATPGALPTPVGMGRTPAQASLLGRTLDERIVGHRGSREGDHGNTIGSLERAAAQGARWIEFDVHRTKDGELVAIHDPVVNARIPSLVNIPVLNAVAGGTKVRSLNRADLPEVDGQRVPTLNELLQRARELDLKVVAELKEPGYEGQVIEAVRRTHAPQDSVFISFSKDAVRAVEQLAPELRTGLLLVDPVRFVPGIRSVKDTLSSGAGPIRAAEAVGADFVAVHDAMATGKMLGAAAAAGMPVAVWTVNDPARAVQLLQHPQVASVITDTPGRVREALGLPSHTRTLVANAMESARSSAVA